MKVRHFWTQFFSKKNLALSHTTIYGFVTRSQISEKTNEPIQRKLTDRRKDGLASNNALFREISI